MEQDNLLSFSNNNSDFKINDRKGEMKKNQQFPIIEATKNWQPITQM